MNKEKAVFPYKEWAANKANNYVQDVEEDYLIELTWDINRAAEAKAEHPLDPIYPIIVEERQFEYNQEFERLYRAVEDNGR